MPLGMPPIAMRDVTARVAVSIAETVFDSQLETYAVRSSGETAITFGQRPPALNVSTYEKSASRNACTTPACIWVTHSSPRPGRKAISTKPMDFGQGSGGDRVATFSKSPCASNTSMPVPSSRAERMYLPVRRVLHALRLPARGHLPDPDQAGSFALELGLDERVGGKLHDDVPGEVAWRREPDEEEGFREH